MSDELDSLPIFDLSNKEDINKMSEIVMASDNPVVIEIENDKDGYAFGVAIPTRQPNALDYLKDVKDYSKSDKTIYDQIDLSRKLYTNEGIIGTAIDLLVDLSFSKIKHYNVKNEKANKLIKYFLENLNKSNRNISKGIDPFNRACCFEYFVTSNVFPFSKWKTIYVDELKDKYYLPIEITTLDPKIIEIPVESIQFGNKVIGLSLTRVYGSPLMSSTQRDNVLKNLPTKIRNQIKKNENIIELDPFNIYHIKRRGSMYAGWGIPYLARVFSAIASKRRLRALDDNTIDSIINSITIYKIGDKDNVGTLDPRRLAAFSRLMKTPGPTMNLVWSYDVSVEHISPKGEVLGFSDRYADCNQDILYALGISSATISGDGNKAGDVWASIILLMERLEAYREEFGSFIEDLLEKIMQENGFEKEKPKIRFIKPKLNKEDIRNVILAYYDRGLLSKETTLQEGGFDIDDEVKLRKAEKGDIDKTLERPEVPFSPKTPKNSGKNPSGTPNPQTLKPIQKKTQKKDTKSPVNQKTKKVSPRIEGSSKDVVNSFIYSIANELEDIDEFNTNARKSLEDVYEFDSGMANQSFGHEKEFILRLIDYCVSNYDENLSVIDSVAKSLDDFWDNSN